MKDINFSSCIKIDEKIWFISVEGYLMNFNCFTGKTEIVSPENLEELNIKQVVDEMFCIDDLIYFFEQDGSKFYGYNYKTNYCNEYILPKLEMVNWGCFSGIYLWKRKLYIFTKKAGEIYCFDLEDKSFKAVFNKNQNAVRCSVAVENKVYLVSGNKILCYDLIKRDYIKEYLFEKEIHWLNVYGTSFYIVSNTNEVYECDIEFSIIRILYQGKDKQPLSCGRIFVTENKMFLFPWVGYEIYVIDKISQTIHSAISPIDLKYKEIGWAKYAGYYEDKEQIWLANRVANYVVYIDKVSEEIKWMKLIQPSMEEETPYIIKRFYMRKKLYIESEINLEQFLMGITVL